MEMTMTLDVKRIRITFPGESTPRIVLDATAFGNYKAELDVESETGKPPARIEIE